MPAKVPDNFAQVFPEHPHRRMHILLSILAFILVAGSIVVYQIKKTQVQESGERRSKVNDGVTEVYRVQRVQDLRDMSSTTPPISEQRRLEALENLKKLSEQQNQVNN